MYNWRLHNQTCSFHLRKIFRSCELGLLCIVRVIVISAEYCQPQLRIGYDSISLYTDSVHAKSNVAASIDRHVPDEDDTAQGSGLQTRRPMANLFSFKQSCTRSPLGKNKKNFTVSGWYYWQKWNPHRTAIDSVSEAQSRDVTYSPSFGVIACVGAAVTSRIAQVLESVTVLRVVFCLFLVTVYLMSCGACYCVVIIFLCGYFIIFYMFVHCFYIFVDWVVSLVHLAAVW
jgi:hypothetical protein